MLARVVGLLRPSSPDVGGEVSVTSLALAFPGCGVEGNAPGRVGERGVRI